jgi:hypothetical protein
MAWIAWYKYCISADARWELPSYCTCTETPLERATGDLRLANGLASVQYNWIQVPSAGRYVGRNL